MTALRVGGGDVEARIRALSGDVKAILQGVYCELAEEFGAFLLKNHLFHVSSAFFAQVTPGSGR